MATNFHRHGRRVAHFSRALEGKIPVRGVTDARGPLSGADAGHGRRFASRDAACLRPTSSSSRRTGSGNGRSMGPRDWVRIFTVAEENSQSRGSYARHCSVVSARPRHGTEVALDLKRLGKRISGQFSQPSDGLFGEDDTGAEVPGKNRPKDSRWADEIARSDRHPRSCKNWIPDFRSRPVSTGFDVADRSDTVASRRRETAEFDLAKAYELTRDKKRRATKFYFHTRGISNGDGGSPPRECSSRRRGGSRGPVAPLDATARMDGAPRRRRADEHGDHRTKASR